MFYQNLISCLERGLTGSPGRNIFSAIWPGNFPKLVAEQANKSRQQSGFSGAQVLHSSYGPLGPLGGLGHKHFLMDIFKATEGEKMIEGLEEPEGKLR